jgi:hypothetical protein
LEKSDEWSPVAREEGLLKQEEVGEEGGVWGERIEIILRLSSGRSRLEG